MADVSRSSDANPPRRSAAAAIAELWIQNKLISYVSATHQTKETTDIAEIEKQQLLNERKEQPVTFH
jgi:hypothetical protein